MSLVLTNVTNRQRSTWEAAGSSPGILAERDRRSSSAEWGARLELLGASLELRDLKTSSTFSSLGFFVAHIIVALTSVRLMKTLGL